MVTMGTRKRREVLYFILLVCVHLPHFSNADSRFWEVAIPTKPIGKETLEEDRVHNESLNRGPNERNRRIKSGKDDKTEKKTKKWKGYYGGYYGSTYYTTKHHPPSRRPATSPISAFQPVQERDYHFPKPTNKPISYYDSTDLSHYSSYSDMIDHYYIKHGGHSDSIDYIIKPHPTQPTFSPIWSYSVDEDSESPTDMPSDAPTNKPTDVPTASPTLAPIISSSSSPSMDQCMVRVMLDECSTLLQTVQPTEGCDCYNFCGGIYLGCCAINEICPLTCDVPGRFVAGCRFGVTSTPVSANPGQVPTTSPSNEPTEESTTKVTIASTSTTTSASESLPTNEPSTTPTQLANPPDGGGTAPGGGNPPGDTPMPTTGIISISLESFTLEYEITYSRSVAQSDIVVLTTITNSYLQEYVISSFQSDSVDLVDFVTEYISFVEDPGSSVVLVTFKSSAFFDTNTQELPSMIDLEKEVVLAFQEAALNGYLGRVQALPASNVFSTTSEIFMIDDPSKLSTLGSKDSSKTSQVIMIRNSPTESTLESKEFSKFAAASAVSAVAIVITLVGFSWYRTRRKRRRIEASDNFLRRNIDIGSTKDIEVKEYNDDDLGSNRNEERSSLTMLEQIESIEDIQSGFEDASIDNHTFPGSISRRSDFKNGEEYLYEDDTIENDEYEDDSIRDIDCDSFNGNEVADFYDTKRRKIGAMYNIERHFDRNDRDSF